MDKMTLSEKDAAEAKKALQASEQEFLHPEKMLSNVVGMGVGVKWKDGEPTGEPAIVVMVTQKQPKENLRKSEIVPPKLGDMQTDVLTVGQPVALGTEEAFNIPHQTPKRNSLTSRLRPAEGGWSVGHPQITAGTIATAVYRILPGGGVNPAEHGIGVPGEFFGLTNNHVAAASNNASFGDPIFQPGPFDGGTPADTIGFLEDFVPIQFEGGNCGPNIPRPLHTNFVDAAIFRVEDNDLDREIHWVGNVRGWQQFNDMGVGHRLKKVGRTTNLTTGRVLATNVTVDVNYGPCGLARFREQVFTTNMSSGGDSGSLAVYYDNVGAGLLFAGSSFITVFNHFEMVRWFLRVEIAETIMQSSIPFG